MLDKKVFDEVVSLLMEGKEIEGFEYQGYELNRDKNHVNLIIEGLKKKEGYCPCRVQKIPENICCCTDFIENEHCCCGFWKKVESANENISKS